MDDLLISLKKAFADTHAFYIKSHGYHWNTVGPNFYQYHNFFETLYSEVYGSIDSFAEHIRACSGYAPASYSAFSALTSINDEDGIPDVMNMVNTLYLDNAKVLVSLRAAYEAANAANEIGLSNFIQDRYDVHMKHAWMLRSTLRTNP